ncbi:MAG: hypothetical protein GQ579_01920 [Bacteroidales bacterium]|nr:hypothetical protein [Bacteroidales bacterium]
MRENFILILALLFITIGHLHGQKSEQNDSVQIDIISMGPISTGWADEAVTIGYVTAPSVITLMFVSALINEWNAGYAGIPASAMIFLAPPLIYAGGRSVEISKEFSHPRAKLGWTLYALSIIPTSLALYGFTTDWGATLPLTIASGILGTASIVAMTSYAFSRAETAREMETSRSSSLHLGVSPLAGGAMATLVLKF